MALDLRSSELEHQFIQDRIGSIEHNIAELCSHFTKYTKRVGQIRDAGDELSECILKLASKETLNHSLRAVLSQVADILTAVDDYRDAQTKRLDHKVILQLSSYGQICKYAKEDLKKCFTAKTKELTKKQQLEKLRGKKTMTWQQLSQAESEAEKAKNEATDVAISFAKKIDDFERKKLENIKKVFLEFANIELLFHCKAVELYTNAYGAIKEIKIDEDLQEFRNHFKSACTIGDVSFPSAAITSSSPIHETVPKAKELSSLRGGDEQNDDAATVLSSSITMSSKSTISATEVESKDANTLFKMHRWNY